MIHDFKEITMRILLIIFATLLTISIVEPMQRQTIAFAASPHKFTLTRRQEQSVYFHTNDPDWGALGTSVITTLRNNKTGTCVRIEQFILPDGRRKPLTREPSYSREWPNMVQIMLKAIGKYQDQIGGTINDLRLSEISEEGLAVHFDSADIPTNPQCSCTIQ